MKLPLIGGSYTARSLLANAQRCLNLYPEKNPEGAPAPYTYYPTPGLTKLAQGPLAGFRGLYTASTGQLFGALGPYLYYIDSSWEFIQVGQIADYLTPVQMKDNGISLVLVDGTTVGYQVTLSTLAFSTITDPNFLGSTRIDYLDTFLLFNQPGTPIFYSSLSNEVAFDPLYIVSKTGGPDDIVGLIVVHGDIWLLGTQTSEVWNDVGNPNFPFAQIHGSLLNHGCAAPYSVATYDIMLFWVGQNRYGQKTIMMGMPYRAQKISTFAMDAEIQNYSTVADAIGFVLEIDGHAFYRVNFPTADKTWVYDITEHLWHEECWLDNNGVEHRHRAQCGVQAYGSVVVGDWQTGTLYLWDTNNYTDNGTQIVRRRGFSHIVNENKRVVYNQFTADAEVGTEVTALAVAPDFNLDFSADFGPKVVSIQPTMYLRFSDTKGVTWSDAIEQTIGQSGDYLEIPTWWNLGMARDRVFELFWSVPAKVALQGAFIEITPGRN